MLKAGDTLSVTLSASEAVRVTEGGTLQLNIGGQTVNANYNADKSGTRSLVFEYTVGNNLNDTQGVSVVGLTGATIKDMADNAADQSLNGYNGLPVFVDTTAPVVLAQVPIDNSIVGNAGVRSVSLSFGEAINKGSTGGLTLKDANGNTIASWAAADGTVSSDELSMSYALPTSLTTLTAGNYTIVATGSPVIDKAGNAISTSALASDGIWSFTVGAVSIGIDKVGGDNLLNGEDIKSDITLSGSLSGEGSTSVTAADMQVWLRHINGSTAVQAKVTSLNNGSWNATLAAADAANLKGGYVVKVNIDAADVQASATSALLVDTQAQVTLGAVAGDNKISLTEQSIINSGKSLSYSFVAEKGSSGSITFTNGSDAAKTVTKTFTSAAGNSPDSVTLSKADLIKLGTGNFTVTATVTDVAGNTNDKVTQAFSIEAPPAAAKIDSITLQGNRSGTLIQGDTLTAVVNFDKAVTVNNTTSLKLAIDVDGTTRQADFASISADRKQLIFSYKVVAEDQDGDGVALNANALQLGTGTNKAVIKDVALGTAAIVTSPQVAAVSTLKLDGSIKDTPADLALNVIEAGLTSANTPSAGKASASGKLLKGGEITDSKTISKVQFGTNAEVTLSGNTDTEVVGSYGKWTINSDGSYTYTLNNEAANSLKADDKPTESLKFWVSGATDPVSATITIKGSNDAPTVSTTAITQVVTESNTRTDPVSVNLLQGASDVDMGETATLSVTNLTYKVGTGAASTTLPAGLTLSVDGKTLSIDPAHAAFNSLAQGAKLDIVVSYLVKDAQGATVKQSATLTITGTNDAPTLTVNTATNSTALAQNASESTGLSSINLLQGAKDADPGDTLSVSNVTYTVAGSVTGNNGADLPAGISLGLDGLLRLDTRHPDYNNMKSGDTKAIVASYTISDGKGGSVAQTATFNLTGSNDAPQVNTTKALLGATATAGGSFNYSFDANAFTDPEGDTLSYSATLVDGEALPTWLSFTPSTRSFSGTAPASSTASQLSIKVTASDGTASTSLSTSQTFTLAINPTGATVAVVDQSSVTESGIDSSGNVFAGTAIASGNVTNNDETDTDKAMLSVTALDGGTAMLVFPIKAQSGSSSSRSNVTTLKGIYGSLQLGADGSYTYTLDNAATATQRLKSDQVVSDVFTYQLKDSTGQTAQSQLVVQVTGSNDAPVLSTSVTVPTSFTLATGKAFTWTVPTGLFTDPDADTFSLSALQVTGNDSSSTTDTLPTWLKFDPVNRTVSGTPPEGITGTTTVRISASDGKGGTVSQDITLNLSLPAAPVSTADTNQVVEAGISPTGIAVGQAIASGNVLGNDSRSASSFSVTSADVGTVTGTSTLKAVSTSSTASSGAATLTSTFGSLKLGADGSYIYTLKNDASAVQALKANEKATDTFTYELTDSTGQKARTQLTINLTGSNDAPVLTASNDSTAITQTVTESNTSTAPISINLLQGARDIDGVGTASETATLKVTDITYKVGTGNVSTILPAGLTLGTDGKTLNIDPASAAFNSLAQGVKRDILVSYLIQDDQKATVAQKATIIVTGTNDAPTVSAAITQAVTESNTNNTPVSINLLHGASDVDTGDILSVTGITYKVSNAATGNNGADLPSGVTLSADGKTLSVDTAHAAFDSLKSGATQTITASYSVNDGKGGSVPQITTLTVTGTNDAPTVVGTLNAQTAVKNVNFRLDVSSAFNDADAGDTATYNLSGTGAMGLSIDANGVITGTYTNTRDAQDVTVTRTDGSNAKATQTFSLRVVDKPVIALIAPFNVASKSVGKSGDVLDLEVQFTEPVTITGNPTLTLNINGADVTATFKNMVQGNNAVAIFTAIVPANNNGNAISIKSIVLPTDASIKGNTSGLDLLQTAVGQSTSDYLVDNANPEISSSPLSLAELSTKGVQLTATDASRLTWSLVDGGTDNPLFTPSTTEDDLALAWQGLLKPKRTLDYETDKKTYTVKVKATDAVGNFTTKEVTINLTDVNEAPTSLDLNNTVTSLQENTSTTSRVKVADIAITDDAQGGNTLTLDGADKASFEIDANALYLKAGTVLNYESGKTQYAVTVKAQDNTLTFSTALSQDFSLSVTNVNEAPVASALSTQTIGIGQNWSGYIVPAFSDAENDTLSYTATLADGSTLPSWLSFDSNTRSFSIKDGSSTSSLSATNLIVRVSAYDGNLSTSTTFNLNVTADTTPPTASSLQAEAPKSYDRGVLHGTLADTVMLRFSESVKVDDIKTAMTQGQIKMQDSTGTLHSLGNGAVLDAYTPNSLLVSGLSSGADGTYTSTYNTATGTSPAVNFANGFGLSSPNNFTVNTSSTIYTRTASDGTQWYIWQQNGWASWIVSQSSPVDGNGNALPWFLAGTSSSTDPSSRNAVLGVSAWYSKAGALTDGTDPWANAPKLSNANIETQGYGRTFLLALGTGSTAQAGDVLVIDKGSVKDVAGNAASTDVQFTLPADITRPTVSANTPATLVGMDAQGNAKSGALVIGDKIRVTLAMAEAVSVSANTDPSVSLLLDTLIRQATINRAESFKNSATTSSTLVFDYIVKDGDVDVSGGIQLGAYNRNNSNLTDAAGNRFTPPIDLAEVTNSIIIAADQTPPTIAKIYSDDRGVLATSLIADTISFKFNEAIRVDQLEQAFTHGLVKVTSADGTVTRNLGAGATVEATYPSEIAVTGFSAQANGTYKTLWSSSQGQNVGLPMFSGFSYVSGVSLTPDANYAAYKHTDSATGQEFYFWRPSGYASYVLTPVNSVTGSDPQTWWSASTNQTTVSQAVPREGVLLAADWYSRSGTSISGTQVSTLPTFEASGGAFTFSLSLGTGSNVQQGDKLVFDKSGVADLAGNSPSADLSIDLPADITRPTFGTATVTGFKKTWSSSTNTSTYTETSHPLVEHDRIRVEIPMTDTIKVYQSGVSNGYVTLDIGGKTRYAYLNLQASSSNGSTTSGFSSNKLVYDYYIQADDSDTQGGITVGTMNRGSVGMFDAANNRPVVISDVIENSNTITVGDTLPPSLGTSYASGNTVVLQASEALDAANLPSTEAFKVMVNGSSSVVQGVAVSTTNASALVLTLGTAAKQGQSVQVTYTDPSSNDDAKAVQDLAGNDLNGVGTYAINAIDAPTIDYTATSFDKIELAGNTDMRFTIKYTDNVRITGTPRLTLTLGDGSATSTVYANYEAISNQIGGQQVLEFVYRPSAGVKGQISVTALDLNGGTITAYDSAGVVAANTTLSNSSFFTPFTWIYPEGLIASTGDAGNNLLTPWFKTPENTPHQLTGISATGGEGDRDILAMTVLLPSSVTSSSAAQAYSLSYNVTEAGVRQVLLKNGSATVDTYTVPADNNWPTGVEQLLFHAVYKDSAGQVQFADRDMVLLTLGAHEYIEPGNLNQRWLQGSLGDDTLNVSGRDVAQRIFIEGEQGNDIIVGHDGIDLIRGGGGDNLISAGKGDDQVVIRGGNDAIDGGEGTDTLRFDLPGQEKKITVDASGVIHVYSASGSWNTGSFVPDTNGWVERYRLASDYGTDGSNRIAVFDLALGRNVAMAKNMERLQWRLDDNSSGRNTNTFKVGTAGDDALSAADVVLAGTGNDTITLSSGWLHTNDWRYENRALLIDGGSGRDVLELSTYVSGQLSQAFESNSNSINPSRVLQNIEGLNLSQGGYVQLAASDISKLVGSNTNAWGSAISSLDASKQQFLLTATSGNTTVNLTDTSGWTQKTSTVSYNNQTYKLLEHTNGVQLLLDSRASAVGNITYEGGSGGGIIEQPINLPAPVVMRVRSQNNQFIIPGDGGARFTVEMSDAVRITGTPQLQLTLISPDGTQSRTVMASFQRSGSTVDMVQTTLEFVFDYTAQDASDAGWRIHVDSLQLNNGAITHNASSSVNANLQLHRVDITAGDWLLGKNAVVKNSATGTSYNDVILPWASDPASAPTSLSANSTFNNVTIHGGTGDRDVLGIPFMLPTDVTTQEQANQYFLSYASNTDGTVRTISLYKAGVSEAVKVFTVPNFSNSQNINDWPAEIEAMAFYIQYRNVANEYQGVKSPGSFIELWKNGYTSTDAVNGDVYKQGSFRSDTFDVSNVAVDKRVLVKAGYGSDTITGHAGSDEIFGEGGSDSINAGAGDDLIWLSGGNDILNGGDGTDALGAHLHGADARGWVDASHRLHIQSANGSWTNGRFVADADGYASDWVFSFDQSTGDITAKRFAGGMETSETSTATGIESMYFTFQNNNQTSGERLLRGTVGADTLYASQSQEAWLLGLGGNDTFVLDSSLRPFMMGGAGDDTFRLMKTGMTGSEGLQIHGGSGTDTLALGADVDGVTLYKPSNVDAQFSSLEVVDLTGSTTNGALGNTLQMTAAWLREVTDMASTRTFTVNGDANDRVNLLSTDNWALQQSSDQAGYALYQIISNNETLKLYVANGMASAVLA
uniref:Cadherin domain-containing protein n=1 Tax=Curvibacter symbiont subsp. Hydra magnipapillata TaxID=667019 RepID=C9Y923_CURXX|nr:hypothetical protein Csp_A06240 [Curvibacter putative symbiont of Hydra magnipapillata]